MCKPVDPQARANAAMFDPLNQQTGKMDSKAVDQFDQIGRLSSNASQYLFPSEQNEHSSSYKLELFLSGKQAMYNGQATNEKIPAISQGYQASSLSSTTQAYPSNNPAFNPSPRSTPPPQNYKSVPGQIPPTQAPPTQVPPTQTPSGNGYNQSSYAPTSQTYSQGYTYQPSSTVTGGGAPSVSAPTQSYSGQSQAQVYIGGGDSGFQSGGYGNSGGNTGTNPNPYSRTATGGTYPQQPPAGGYDYSASGQYPTSYQAPYPNY